jgi:hypothetical protein
MNNIVKTTIAALLLLAGCDKDSPTGAKVSDPSGPSTQTTAAGRPGAGDPITHASSTGCASPLWWLDHARQALREAGSREQDDLLVFDLAMTRLAAGDASAESDALHAVKSRGIAVLIARSYAKMAVAQADAGNREGATRTLSLAMTAVTDMDSVDRRDSVYSEIAKAQARLSDLDGAAATADRIVSVSGQGIARRAMVAEAVRAGDFQRAETVADQIPDTDEFSNAGAYEAIALGLVRRSETPKAKAMADRVSLSRMRSSVYEGIAVAQARRGDQVGAQQTFEQSKALARMIPSFSERMWRLQAIVTAQAAAGLPAAAVVTLRELADGYGDTVLPDVAAAYSRAGDDAAAEAVAAKVHAPELAVKTDTLIAESCATRKDDTGFRTALSRAKKTAVQITDERERTTAWSLIARASAIGGDLVAVRAAIKEMPGAVPPWIYGAIAGDYLGHGGDPTSLETWFASLDLSPPERARACVTVASSVLDRQKEGR